MSNTYGFSVEVSGNAITQIKQINNGVNDLEKNTSRATSNMASSFSNVRNVMGGMLAAMGVSSLLSGLKDAATSVITLGANMQQTKMSFEVMLGSADKANKMVADLQKFASVTPFTSTEVMENSKLLLNYGVAAESILPTMKMLGDASQGNQEKFKGMSYAYAQVQANGRLMGQDLLQLINAGFNPLQEISKKTGKSLGELRKDMEGGKISAAMVTDAFKSVTGEGGRFFGMMDKQSKTVAGLWSTFVDTVQMTAIGMFDKIQPQLTAFINKLIENKDAIAGALGSVFDTLIKIGSAIGSFVGWLTSGSISSELFKASLFAVIAGMTAFNIATSIASANIGGMTIVTVAKTIADISATTATWGLVAGLNALNLAFTISPIGWFAIAIGAVAVASYGLYKVFSDNNEIIKKTTDSTRKYNQQLLEEKEKMNMLFAVAKNEKLSKEERKKAIGELNSNYGSYIGNIIKEKDAVNDLKEAQDRANKSFLDKIELDAKKSILSAEITKVAEQQQKYLNAQLKFSQVAEKSGVDVNKMQTDLDKSNKAAIFNREKYTQTDMSGSLKSKGKALEAYDEMKKQELWLNRLQSGALNLRSQLGIKETFDENGQKTGASALSKSAMASSEIGAKGGLGEAKVINIRIDTMQKNEVKNVSDFKNISNEAIEILTRALNNLVYSASATM